MTKRILVGMVTIVFLTPLVLFVFIYGKLHKLSQDTGQTTSYFPQVIKNTVSNPSLTTNFNFIILGLDPRNDSLEKTETTDTIIVARLTSAWKLNLVSVPRDLWVYSLDNKVNQIYPLSLTRPDKFSFIQTEFSKLVNQPISRTLVITTQSLVELTKIIGGVDVYLDEGFIDKQYPNSEYIKSPSPLVPIYITVEFKTGIVHLNESNVTAFVRSRKSLIGGTDIGRITRQQLLLDALLQKVKNPAFYKDYNHLVQLYNFYKRLDTNFTDSDLISLGLIAFPKIPNISLSKSSVPTGENPKTDILYHPQKSAFNQWVFIPQDKEYSSFHRFISESLSL